MAIFQFFAFLIITISFSVTTARHSHTNLVKKPVLVLDVDGTLYDDDCEIESQIKDNCEVFALHNFNISAEESQALHNKYGSTVRGLYMDYTKSESRSEVFTNYYNDVYPQLNMNLLHKYRIKSRKLTSGTGYSDNVVNKAIKTRQSHEALFRISNHGIPIVIASNSPVFHVKRVLSRLGLAKLPIHSIITPERRIGLTKCEKEFWKSLLSLFPIEDGYECTLIDDNFLNCKIVESLGIRGIRIRDPDRETFHHCLTKFLLSFNNNNNHNNVINGFKIDDNKYLD